MTSAATTSHSPTPSSPGRASSATTAPAAPRTRSRPSFPIAYSQPPPSISSSSTKSPRSTTPAKLATSATTASTPTPTPAPSRPPPPADSSSHSQRTKHFVAPAHPQSHHLHSLPPREKTTRTLILDHTAWQHTRTRFAQGRCELGMHVRFKRKGQVKREAGESGGSGTRNAFYISSGRTGGANAFGNPPEIELASSEDEGEDGEGRESDGEGVDALSYGAQRGTKGADLKEARVEDTNTNNPMDVDHDITSASDQAASSDATHAPELAGRAIGIEKVLHAMLAQPPPPPPRSPSPTPYALHSSHAHSQHYRAPPSASTNTLTAATRSPHTLPNGVRLRLALLALVNDLFQRQPPPTSDSTSLTKPQTTGSSTTTSETAKAPSVPSPLSSPTQLPPPSLPVPNALPPALAALVQISSQPFFGTPNSPSFHTLPLPTSSAGDNSAPVIRPISGTGIKTSSSSFGGPKKIPADGTQPARPPPPLFSWTRPSGSSASPSSSSLVTSLPDSATSPVSPSFSRAPGPLTATSRALPTSWKGSTPRYHHTGPKAAGSSSLELRRRAAGRTRELYAAGCHAGPGSRGSYRSDVTTYGGVHPPATPGYPLQRLKMLCPRHLLEACAICTSSGKGVQTSRIGAGLLRKTSCCGGGAGVLMDMMPMFLRLSALVAMELGREARGEEAELDEGASAISTAPSSSAARPAQPTRAWYALLCGLLTRSVIEGYVARGWKGAEYVEVLMSVGVKARKGSGTSTDAPAVVEEVAGEFEPDEMPGIIEASKVLFAVEADDPTEYSTQMEGRLSEFLSIPNATPDLATHLMALSTQYPAAPVERAALRFCEAVAQWRGRPELETYKTAARASSPGTLPIHALLASPAPRRPHIERYFRIAPPSVTTGLRKRANTTEGEERAPKREKIDADLEESAGAVQDADGDSEWVGPYGV